MLARFARLCGPLPVIVFAVVERSDTWIHVFKGVSDTWRLYTNGLPSAPKADTELAARAREMSPPQPRVPKADSKGSVGAADSRRGSRAS